MKAAELMKRRIIISSMAVVAVVAVYLVCWQKSGRKLAQPVTGFAKQKPLVDQAHSARRAVALGDIVTDAEDPQFLNQVFPKAREFFAKLDRLDVNPLAGELQPAACSKIRISTIPDGIICRFVIGDGWAVRYTQNSTFSGVTHFGQRGPDNPYRAISHADTNALRRLSQGAVVMPEPQVWTTANSVADAFGIDRSKFEEPTTYEEGLFEHRLGIYSVRYRKKGSNPVNQLNYTRSFSLKATSTATAVLVSYSHLEAWNPR